MVIQKTYLYLILYFYILRNGVKINLHSWLLLLSLFPSLNLRAKAGRFKGKIEAKEVLLDVQVIVFPLVNCNTTLFMKIHFLLLFFISCLTLACKERPRVTVQHYLSENTKKMDLPFSDAVLVGDMIYLSGNLGNVPGTFKLVEGGIRSETKQTMENIQTVLAANDATMNDIIKCQVFIADIKEWPIFNEEYVKFFPNKKPARSALGANGLALGARVEVECVACRGCGN